MIQSSNRQRISPRARRALRNAGLAIDRVSGSGPRQRIVEADVRSAMASVQPHDGAASVMRRTIAQRTTESFATIPHFYLRREIDASYLVAHRDAMQRDGQPRITFTDLLLRAMAKGLQQHPAANCVWRGNGLLPLNGCAIGLVVGLADGLVVPVFHNIDGLSLYELAKQREALVNAARQGTLPRDALQGGALSLSNLGTEDIDEFSAIIMPGQTAMLAVGKMALRPFVVDGRICVRPTLRLCLSVDHRVLDGRPAAQLLSSIAHYLEYPAKKENHS